MARRWDGGHSSPVLCVGLSGGPEGVLASGAEGGEVVLWSQEGTPLAQLRVSGDEDVTCAVFSPTAPGLLYVSHGEAVSVLDPRCLKGPVEMLQSVGEEEINSLSVNETGDLLASADDSGAVKVLELKTGKVSRTLRRHTNICSSVAFRPQRPQSLVSAGLDMQVMLWSLQKARPVWTFSLQEAAEEDEGLQQKAGKLFNPPLAHCVSAATCGNVLACAAEDGRVHLMRIGGGSRLERRWSLKAHTQGVSQAHFVNFLPHPYWLATGGNDGLVALWDVSDNALASTEGKSKAKAATHRRRHKAKAKPKTQTHDDTKGKAQTSKEEDEDEKGEEEQEECGPGSAKCLLAGPKLSFSQEDQVNWVCPAMLKGQPSLVVAGQSPSLAVYSLTGL